MKMMRSHILTFFHHMTTSSSIFSPRAKTFSAAGGWRKFAAHNSPYDCRKLRTYVIYHDLFHISQLLPHLAKIVGVGVIVNVPAKYKRIGVAE